ncbi:MAG: hypothetical protein Q9162_004628 [Coniocarpon cinnabarinum]
MNGTQDSTRTGSPRVASGIWARAKTSSKAGFDKLWATADKLGDPVNKLSNKIGSEAFWPTTIDKESEKAARILKSFCKDGFYQEETTKPASGPQQKQRVLKRIPASVIQNCTGLAIFTTMRTGLWVSGAGGSGILVGKKDDGTWSQPCGIMLHTAGLGFLVGVDIYDCVLVLNTPEALAAFSRWRATVGGEISAVAGPAGIGGVLDSEVHRRQAPIFTYLKSRGFYAGVQIDGTVIIERTDENERFYGEKVSAKDILAGRVQSREPELRTLMATLKSAEGDAKVDRALLPDGPPPADMQVVADGTSFGIPDREDPDPYGVHALEKEGFVIKEAGSHTPASVEQFDFNPSITSPVYDTFRRSNDTNSRRGSWRSSVMSSSTMAEREREKPRYVTSDSATQTDLPLESSPDLKSGKDTQRDSNETLQPQAFKSPAAQGLGIEVVPEETSETTEPGKLEQPTPTASSFEHTEPTTAGQDAKAESKTSAAVEKEAKETPDPKSGSGSDEEDEEPEIHEAPVVHQVTQAARPQVVSRAQVATVAVPKRGPPPMLPPRHPARQRSFGAKSPVDGSAQTSDNENADSASIASFRSIGKPTSIRSDRKGSVQEAFASTSTSAVQSPAQTPAEEKSNPIPEQIDTTAGQSETSQAATPVRLFKATSLSPERTTTSARSTPKELSPPARPRVSPAATARQNSNSSVSALKFRFEQRPPPINTSQVGSRPSSSNSNSHPNRSVSPVKQLSKYTTSAEERKGGRLSPGVELHPASAHGNKIEPVDAAPGAFPSDSFDGASDTRPQIEVPQLNGVHHEEAVSDAPDEPAQSLRTGRSPLRHRPDSGTNITGTDPEPTTIKVEKEPSPPPSPRKGPSLAGMRASLHPMRDDESDGGSRSRSISPVKSPIKVDIQDDFS